MNFKLSYVTYPLIGLLPLETLHSEVLKKEARPNILFCIADDASFYHFSANGCSWVSTPNFDKVANNGVLFTRCYTPNAKSAPSRACILTGQYSFELRQAGNHITNFPTDLKVFTDVLREHGYQTGYTGKPWAPGNPGIINGKPRVIVGTPYQKRKLKAKTKGIAGTDYAGNFKDFLMEQKENAPWFFWFGCWEPHRGYEYGTGVRLNHKKLSDVDFIPSFWPDCEEVRNDLLDYGYEIEHFDNQLGQMLTLLEQQGRLHNTLIIVTSDNGMPFPRSKSNNFELSNHMPLAIMWADQLINPGRKVNDYISFIDLAPTILDAVGISKKESNMPITGESILDYLKDNVKNKIHEKRRQLVLARERTDCCRPQNQGYPVRSIILDSMMYVHRLKPNLWPAGNPELGYSEADGSPTKTKILELMRSKKNIYYWNECFNFRTEESLYNIIKDPECLNDLIHIQSFEPIKKKLKNNLDEVLKENKDPRLGKSPDVFDHYKYMRDRSWNFYEKVKSGQIKEPWKHTGWINPTDYSTHPSNYKYQSNY